MESELASLGRMWMEPTSVHCSPCNSQKRGIQKAMSNDCKRKPEGKQWRERMGGSLCEEENGLHCSGSIYCKTLTRKKCSGNKNATVLNAGEKPNRRHSLFPRTKPPTQKDCAGVIVSGRIWTRPEQPKKNLIVVRALTWMRAYWAILW